MEQFLLELIKIVGVMMMTELFIGWYLAVKESKYAIDILALSLSSIMLLVFMTIGIIGFRITRHNAEKPLEVMARPYMKCHIPINSQQEVIDIGTLSSKDCEYITN